MTDFIRREDRLFDPVTGRLIGFIGLTGQEQLDLDITLVDGSRDLTQADWGKTLECTVADLVLNVPATGMPAAFYCTVDPKGATQVTSAAGVTLNKATGTQTRSDSNNQLFIIQRSKAVPTDYTVTGT